MSKHCRNCLVLHSPQNCPNLTESNLSEKIGSGYYNAALKVEDVREFIQLVMKEDGETSLIDGELFISIKKIKKLAGKDLI